MSSKHRKKHPPQGLLAPPPPPFQARAEDEKALVRHFKSYTESHQSERSSRPPAPEPPRPNPQPFKGEVATYHYQPGYDYDYKVTTFPPTHHHIYYSDRQPLTMDDILMPPSTSHMTSFSQERRRGAPLLTNSEEIPAGVPSTVTFLAAHHCAGCGQPRSHAYHKEHPLIPNQIAPPNFCRKCEKKIKKGESIQSNVIPIKDFSPTKDSSKARRKSSSRHRGREWSRTRIEIRDGWYDEDESPRKHRGRRDERGPAASPPPPPAQSKPVQRSINFRHVPSRSVSRPAKESPKSPQPKSRKASPAGRAIEPHAEEEYYVEVKRDGSERTGYIKAVPAKSDRTYYAAATRVPSEKTKYASTAAATSGKIENERDGRPPPASKHTSEARSGKTYYEHDGHGDITVHVNNGTSSSSTSNARQVSRSAAPAPSQSQASSQRTIKPSSPPPPPTAPLSKNYESFYQRAYESNREHTRRASLPSQPPTYRTAADRSYDRDRVVVIRRSPSPDKSGNDSGLGMKASSLLDCRPSSAKISSKSAKTSARDDPHRDSDPRTDYRNYLDYHTRAPTPPEELLHPTASGIYTVPSYRHEPPPPPRAPTHRTRGPSAHSSAIEYINANPNPAASKTYSERSVIGDTKPPSRVTFKEDSVDDSRIRDERYTSRRVDQVEVRVDDRARDERVSRVDERRKTRGRETLTSEDLYARVAGY